MNENDFEAHVKYIDIHYLIIGKERISCVPLEKTELKIPYSSDNDIAFYKYANDDICNCIVGCGYFLLLYPQDAHMPQLCVDVPEQIKKVTIKIKI